MKICAIICEFNPFHNGHKYLLERARKISGCDAVVCVMSGCFTQRGEMCRTDKYLRAKHAVLCGADAVIELPAPFAVAPAEIFAAGAAQCLKHVPAELSLAFGCERGQSGDFVSAAAILNEESATFKVILARNLDSGESFIKSRLAAFTACGGDTQLLSSPNNILGVEYARAFGKTRPDAKLLPVKRIGAGYCDCRLAGGYSSASGIRANADSDAVKGEMPECSYEDFINSKDNTELFERLAADNLYLCDKDNLKRVYGCTEGLENLLKNLVCENGYAEVVEKAASKRYSKSRIRRILCANLLRLYADETEKFLNCRLAPKVLAVKKQKAARILPLLSAEKEPDAEAKKCLELTSQAYALWQYLNKPLIFNNQNEKMILV